jgi:hypothetical protein
MSDRYGLPGQDDYIESYYTIGQRKNVLNLAKANEPVNNQVNPTPEQLEAAGYLPVVDCDYDPLTQKLGKDKRYGSVVHPEIFDLTLTELALLLASKINAKYSEVTIAYQSADSSLFAGYTYEQQKTFYKQEDEANRWQADNNVPTPFIDGRVAFGNKTKQQIVDLIVGISSQITATAGMYFEKYQSLIEDLVNVDQNGDYLAEKTKLDSIVW